MKEPGINLLQRLQAKPFSAREWQVLDLLCEGQTAVEIAAVLGLSPRTVHNHMQRMLDKAGVRRATALTFYAAELKRLQA